MNRYQFKNGVLLRTYSTEVEDVWAFQPSQKPRPILKSDMTLNEQLLEVDWLETNSTVPKPKRKVLGTPWSYVPNVSHFKYKIRLENLKGEKIDGWDPIFKEKGIKKRLKGTTEFELYDNKNMNRFIEHQVRKLLQYRDKKMSDHFWNLSLSLIQRSNSFRVLAFNHVLPKWYTKYELKFILRINKRVSHLINYAKTDLKYIRKFLKKSETKWRTIGIPSYEWRIYLHMISNFLSMYLEPTFLESQHGFRTQRGTLSAWKHFFTHELYKKPYIWEFDLSKFFDSANLNYVSRELRNRGVPFSICEYLVAICTCAPTNPTPETHLLGREEYTGKPRPQKSPESFVELNLNRTRGLHPLSSLIDLTTSQPLMEASSPTNKGKTKGDFYKSPDLTNLTDYKDSDVMISGIKEWTDAKASINTKNRTDPNVKPKSASEEQLDVVKAIMKESDNYIKNLFEKNLLNLTPRENLFGSNPIGSDEIKKKLGNNNSWEIKRESLSLKEGGYSLSSGVLKPKKKMRIEDYDKTLLHAFTEKMRKKGFFDLSTPRINPSVSGTPQGNPISPTLALVGIQKFLSQDLWLAGNPKPKEFGSLSYADDGIFYSDGPFEAQEHRIAGVMINKEKSGWIKYDGKWKKDFKFLGLKLCDDGKTWKAETRNGSTLILGDDIKIIMRKIEDLKKEGYSADLNKESPGVMHSWKKVFESTIIGLVQNRLYQGTFNLENLEQDFRLKFVDNSWTQFNKHAITQTPVTVFNLSTFASRSLANIFRSESRIRRKSLNFKISMRHVGTLDRNLEYIYSHRFPSLKSPSIPKSPSFPKKKIPGPRPSVT